MLGLVGIFLPLPQLTELARVFDRKHLTKFIIKRPKLIVFISGSNWISLDSLR